MINITNLNEVDSLKNKNNSEFFFIIYLATILFSILLNLNIVLSFIANKKLRSYTNFYYLSISLCGLMVSFTIMPFDALELLDYETFNKSLIICIIWYSLDCAVCSISVFSLMVIAILRYISIAHPHFKLSIKKHLIIISIIWTLPIIFWFSLNGLVMVNHNFIDCEVSYDKILCYVLISLFCISPLLVSISINLLTMVKIKNRYNKIDILKITRSNSLRKRSNEKKAIQILLISSLISLICWTGFMSTYPIVRFIFELIFFIEFIIHKQF
jgi:hypothetical protein